MTKEREDGLSYDPYKKEKSENPPLHVLLNQQNLIDRRIAGEEVDESELEGSGEEEEEEVVPENMTVAELKVALDDADVAFPSNAKKEELVKLYTDYLEQQ